MIKPGLLYVFLLLSLQTFGQAVSVRAVKAPPPDALPGQTISISFSVRNNAGTAIPLLAVPELPAGWKQVLTPGVMVVPPADSGLILLAYRIPMNSRSGEHELKIRFMQSHDQSLLHELQFSQSVQGYYELELNLSGIPSYVMAGSTITTQLMVRNHGNRSHQIQVEGSSLNISVPDNLELVSDSFILIPISMSTSPDLLRSQLQGFHVHVSIPEAPGLRYSLFEQVRVIPSRQIPPELYHRFPVSLGLHYLRAEDQRGVNDGFQAVLQGQGNLDVKGVHNLEFRARGPNQFGMSNLGSYDEYFLYYSNPWVNLYLGDHSYTISPLMEANRYGRGFSAGVSAKSFEAGAGTYVPRFFPDVLRVNSAYAGYTREDKYRLRVNMMSKEFAEKAGTANLYGVEAGTSLLKVVDMEGEYSLGELNGQTGEAYRGELRIGIKRFDGSLAYMNASQYYPGYYKNTENYQANLGYRFRKLLSIGLNLHRDFNNAALDTLIYAAPRTERIQAYLNFNLPSAFMINLRAGRREHEDRLEPRLFHYKDDFLHLRLSRQGSRTGVEFQAELSRNQNLLLESVQNQANYMMYGSFSYRPTNWLNLTSFLSHSGNTRYSADIARYWYYGGSLRLDYKKRTRFNVTARNSFETSEYYRDRSYFESGLSQSLGRHHEVYMAGQYGSRQGILNKAAWSYRIGYALKIGVPLKRTAEANASLTGTVTPGSPSMKVEGLVLHLNGYTSVTDAQGRYTFYNMKPGDYFLVIDRESMPVNAVPSIPQALPVSVGPGEERILDFSLEAGGTIFGNLKLNGKGNGQMHTPEENVAFTSQHFVIVEVIGPQGKQRTITGKDGSFRFFPLYPGEYQLKVYRNGMPKDYHLEAERFDLRLEGGASMEINIILVRKEKLIRFQEQTIEVKVKKK